MSDRAEDSRKKHNQDDKNGTDKEEIKKHLKKYMPAAWSAHILYVYAKVRQFPFIFPLIKYLFYGTLKSP